MKQVVKCYGATETTYTFNRHEVMSALAKAHNIKMPYSPDTWEGDTEEDGGFSIRIRVERLQEPEVPPSNG